MIVGVDVHKRTHTAALIDKNGVYIASVVFANSSDGIRKLRKWLKRHKACQANCVVGVENAAGYGVLVVEALLSLGFEVLNVPGWRTVRQRRHLGEGKSDPVDAQAVAEVVLRKRHKLGTAQESELVRTVQLLESLRDQLVASRTQEIQRLRAVLTQCDPDFEATFKDINQPTALKAVRRRRFKDSTVFATAKTVIKSHLDQIELLNKRIDEVEQKQHALLEDSAQSLCDLHGVGLRVATKLVAQAGDVRRFKNEASFARFCGVSPLPCGSGRKSERHRLNRGGNRQLNSALHRVAITQSASFPKARDYLQRKEEEGKTRREARRALKRHLSNVVYRELYRWAENTLVA